MRFNQYLNEGKKGIKTDYEFNYYEDLMRHSPQYRKIQNMSKKDLINKLGYYLFKHQNKESVTKASIEIAKRKMTSMEMADRLYSIQYSSEIME